MDNTGTATKLRDFISFSSLQEPVAFDTGRYGIDQPGNPGADDHVKGEPSVGLHRNIAADTLGNHDYFADPTLPLWVSGAQKYGLGTLADGASSSFSVVLTVTTATVVDKKGECSGIANGGASRIGGVDWWFEEVTEVGNFFAEYDAFDDDELEHHIDEGEFGAPTFPIPGMLQIFELEYDGEYDGEVHLTMHYDPALLDGVVESDLGVYHYRSGMWVAAGGSVNASLDTVSFTTGDLSPFAIGLVPEPGSLSLMGAALVPLFMRRRSGR